MIKANFATIFVVCILPFPAKSKIESRFGFNSTTVLENAKKKRIQRRFY